jgi:hypothetical protein
MSPGDRVAYAPPFLQWRRGQETRLADGRTGISDTSEHTDVLLSEAAEPPFVSLDLDELRNRLRSRGLPGLRKDARSDASDCEGTKSDGLPNNRSARLREGLFIHASLTALKKVQPVGQRPSVGSEIASKRVAIARGGIPPQS